MTLSYIVWPPAHPRCAPGNQLKSLSSTTVGSRSNTQGYSGRASVSFVYHILQAYNAKWLFMLFILVGVVPGPGSSAFL
jgi:hypothetical protein